jgi:steroid delta-isomerase-like uncharacterized protein
MSAQSNAQFARTLYQHFNEGDLEAALSMAADDVNIVLYPLGQTFKGREGFEQFMHGFHDAFPDMKVEVKNQVAADDSVVNEFVARGTHTAPLMTPAGPVPPTGRKVELNVCEVWGLRDGKLASVHNYQDLASMMRQLGLIN